MSTSEFFILCFGTSRRYVPTAVRTHLRGVHLSNVCFSFSLARLGDTCLLQYVRISEAYIFQTCVSPLFLARLGDTCLPLLSQFMPQ